MQIVQMHPDELKPYERNPRKHSEHQVEAIANSITEFGFTNPILIDSKKGIIAGHGRLLAARKLGLEQVPVLELTHLTDPQKRAYVIADNKLALNADWDYDLLVGELQALDDSGYAVSLTGFSEAEFAALLGDPIQNPNAEWKGMPEYEQDSSMFKSLIVHFYDQKGIEDFRAATGMQFTDQAKFAWYPAAERDSVNKLRVVSQDDAT